MLLLRDTGLAVALVVAWCWPLLGSGFFQNCEQIVSRWGRHKKASVLGVIVLVIGLRLAVLPFAGPPVPQTHDEFSYLLAGDTFAHGHLANPPHPMWVFLETFHVNLSPTYASKYPPGQGAVLALGEVLGHPWIGVLLSVAALCGAITWMLQGWVAGRWALLGGLLAAAQFSAINPWMESYWGGAVAAMGGALMLGALPRIVRQPRTMDAIVLSFGIGILANSRPYEGLVFTVLLLSVLGWRLFRDKKHDFSTLFWRVLLPGAWVLGAVGAFIAYYDWRLTGHPFVLPYTVNSRHYAISSFLWDTPPPLPHYLNPQFEDFYGRNRDTWFKIFGGGLWNAIKLTLVEKLSILQSFYAPPQLGIPLALSLLLLARNRKVRICAGMAALFVASLFVVLWLSPHYAAPFTSVVYVLIIFGFRYLRRYTKNDRPIGIGLTRALVIFHFAILIAGVTLAAVKQTIHRDSEWAVARARVQARLETTSGQHLVVVRYSSNHDPNKEWVYNLSNIDHAKVVWARDIPGQDMYTLLQYFHDRTLWLAEPDANPAPRLTKCGRLTSGDPEAVCTGLREIAARSF